MTARRTSSAASARKSNTPQGATAKSSGGKAVATKTIASRTASPKAVAGKVSAAKTPSVKPRRNLDAPDLYINRELSWLDFNQRVLEEARDATNPPLERLKFLTIVSSNLDEFFEIRVAGVQQQAESRPASRGPDGMTPAQVLDEIGTRVQAMVAEQYACYNAEVVPLLAEHGIDLLTVDDLDEKGQRWAQEYFVREVFPVLTPLAIDPSHPFPQLLNKSLNLAVRLRQEDDLIPSLQDFAERDELDEDDGIRFAVVQVPRVMPRLVRVPDNVAPAGRHIYVFLSSLISAHVGKLFHGMSVEGCYAFRVTRNSELYLDEDEADNLLEAMQEQLQRRRRGDAVRLEVQRGCDPEVARLLLDTFELDEIDLFEVDGPVNLLRLMAVYAEEARPDLKDAPFRPALPRALREVEDADEFFAAIRHEDILLHHPYESFTPVVDLVSLAADDPNTLAIKQTLYRAGSDSPIVRALMRAAQNGKQVTALVELKARFDEENNIQWARAMEEAGVHVLYGLVGLKTHSKLCMVVRREADGIRRYLHIGTGNYNTTTARIYTDLGLLTARADLGEDAAAIFNLLTGMSQYPGLKKLWMAPFGLDTNFKNLIKREAAHARKGRPASIVAKMNALVDPDIIQELYRASQAGVKIDLIVRGVCCLLPGVAGVSEHIRVRSIVDRFLEHPRVYSFGNGGENEIYLGSADWMPRNFVRRVEVVAPVEDEKLKKRLRDEVLWAALHDTQKARLLGPDGCYTRAKPRKSEEPLRSQAWLLQRATGTEPAPSLVTARPVASPLSVRPLTVRRAPQVSVEGRAGTSADPVLQGLAQGMTEAQQQFHDGLRTQDGAAEALNESRSAAPAKLDGGPPREPRKEARSKGNGVASKIKPATRPTSRDKSARSATTRNNKPKGGQE